jgi:hypothetical protein
MWAPTSRPVIENPVCSGEIGEEQLNFTCRPSSGSLSEMPQLKASLTEGLFDHRPIKIVRSAASELTRPVSFQGPCLSGKCRLD